MQLNFLQENILTALQESEKRTAVPKANLKTPPSSDLFNDLPTAPQPKRITKKKPTEKAEGAFKNISEVATILDVPQHVLRFWESNFSQIKPLKMGGGRRYYRPEDIDILSKIQNLLYKQGYTIKGAKKALGLENTKTIETNKAPTTDKNITLTDKQEKQAAAILQELLNLKEVLASYLPNKIST